MFGAPAFDFLGDGRIACTYVDRGVWNLGIIDTATGSLTRLDTPFSEMGRGELRASGNRVVFSAGAPDRPMTLLSLELSSGALIALQRAHDLEVDSAYLSSPERVEFETTDGRMAHAFYYAPLNPDFVAPEGGEAAAAGQKPRRADSSRADRTGPGHPILDQPGIRRG